MENPINAGNGRTRNGTATAALTRFFSINPWIVRFMAITYPAAMMEAMIRIAMVEIICESTLGNRKFSAIPK